jgi:hypothetical protein
MMTSLETTGLGNRSLRIYQWLHYTCPRQGVHEKKNVLVSVGEFVLWKKPLGPLTHSPSPGHWLSQ